MQRIEQNIRANNSKKAFDMVKTLMGKWQSKMKAIEDKDWKLQRNIDEILARWKEYCEELYNHEVQIYPETMIRSHQS